MKIEKLGTRDRKTRTAEEGGDAQDTSSQTPAPAKPKQTGVVPQGGANPGENRDVQVQVTQPARPTGVVAVADLRPEGGNPYFYGNAGQPPARNTWQTERARLEARQAEIHERNVAAQNARARSLMGEVKAAGNRVRAREQAVMDGTDLSSLKSITNEMWSNWGGMNGSQKDKDGNPIGGMVDVKQRAADIAALNKWFNSDEAKATSRGFVPAGVAMRRTDENGVKSDKYTIDAANLTNTQLDALLKIKSNSDAKYKDIRARAAAASGPSQHDRDMQLVIDKGFRPEFDKSTGKMLTSREEIAKMAQTYRMNDARAALDGMAPAWNAAKSIQTDVYGNVFTDPKDQAFYQKRAFDAAKAKEAGLVKQLQALGFRADQIADDNGAVDYGRIAAALGASAPKAAQEAAPKAAPRATPKQPAAPAQTPAAPATRRNAAWNKMTISSPAENAAIMKAAASRAEAPANTAAVVAAREAARPSTGAPSAPAAPATSPLFAGLGGAMTDAAGFAEIRGKYNPDAATLRDPAYRRSMAGAVAAGALTGMDLGLTFTGAGGLVKAGAKAVAKKTVMKATAKGLANPAVRGAAKQLAKESSGTAAQNTMAAIDRFARSNPARRRAIDAAQKAADIRKANAAAEAAKTGADKTMDAVGNFWSRVSRAKPKRRVR